MAALLALTVALGLPACGDSKDDKDTGIPNPASVFCKDKGGTVEIVTASDGSQSGLCHLPDGTKVDEWEYYRQFHPDDTTTTTS